MSNEIQLEKEEVEAVLEVRNKYVRLMASIGEVYLEIRKLEPLIAQLREEENRLLNELNELREREQEISEELSTKYGDGQIDIERNVFVPKV